MHLLCLLLIPLAFLLAVPLTLLARAVGHRLNALDGAGVAGQVKAAARPVPNTGGMAIVLAFSLPIVLGLVAVITPLVDSLTSLVPALTDHLPGIRSETVNAVVLLTFLGALHVVGLVDDRRPLGPLFKLAVMLGCALGVVLLTGSRMLTMLDSHVGGPWLSVLLTVLWIVVVTNAFNFLDNMDGLSAGVAMIAAGCFLAAALIHGQWFVGACLALLVGTLGGFLVFNFPWRAGGGGGASIFMGDGGSLVVGFLLAFLTVRTTYYAPGTGGAGGAGTSWYAVFMPVIVLAIPLYDLVSVCAIRLRQGRSPFVGDMQHFSHRLVARGLSRRDAVLIIYGATGVTAIGGIALGSLADWQAMLVGVQMLLVLLVIALYEGRTARAAV
ncbi:MAG: MraY family glycosyltransferase [Phycisphaerales bacterium]